jgi:hypothetical protein
LEEWHKKHGYFVEWRMKCCFWGYLWARCWESNGFMG